MSFLNPLSMPVLRFNSTDAGAPQIKYNARAAGDVKAILKSCLVEGYGAIASAGWTAVNEVGNVIEFISPNVNMSDYRLCVDDNSTTSTTWYHRYQDTRINPTRNSPTKTFSAINNTHASNGWTLIVTELGFYFIEHVYGTYTSGLSSRITYFGQVKLAINSQTNLCFFNIGQSSQIGAIYNLYSTSSGAYYHLPISNVRPTTIATHDVRDSNPNTQRQPSLIEVLTDVFALQTDVRIVGKHAGIMSRIDAGSTVSDMYEVSTILNDNGRPMLKVMAGNGDNDSYAVWQAQGFNIALDYWEY